MCKGQVCTTTCAYRTLSFDAYLSRKNVNTWAGVTDHEPLHAYTQTQFDENTWKYTINTLACASL